MVTSGVMCDREQSAPRGSPLIGAEICSAAGEPRGWGICGGLVAVRFRTWNEKCNGHPGRGK